MKNGAIKDFWAFVKLEYDEKTWRWGVTNPKQARKNYNAYLKRIEVKP